MSVIKRVSKNVSWLAFSEITSKAVGLVLVIVIARYLMPEGFGQYSFAVSFSLIFSVFAEFGLGIFATREIAKNKQAAARYIGNLFSLKLVISIVTFSLIYFSIHFFHKPVRIEHLVYLAGLNVILASYNTFLRAVFRAFEQMKYEAFSRFIEKGLILIFTLTAVFLNLGITAIFVALILGTALSSCYIVWITKNKFTRFKPEFDLNFWKSSLKPSLFFAITSLFIVIYFKIDVVILSQMKGDRITGFYNAAYDLLFAFMFVPMIITTALYPVLANFWEKSKDQFHSLIPRLIKYFFILSLSFSFGLAGLGNYLIRIVYGHKFLDSIPMFQYLSFALIFSFLNYILGTIFNAMNKQHILTAITGFCVILNIGVNFILIPRFSAYGAVFTTILTEASLTFISLYYLNKSFPLATKDNLKKLSKIAFSGLIMAIAIYFLYRFEPILAVLTGFIAYVAILYLLKIFSPKDRLYLQEIIRR